MSATGRNLPGHERSPIDHYRTPSWATIAIWRALYPNGLAPRSVIIDAGSGDGAIAAAISKTRRLFDETCSHVLVEKDVALSNAGRSREDLREALHLNRDFLTMTDFPGQSYGERHVVMNPPYDLAEEFVRHAIKFAGNVVALLRLGFLESAGRASFHQEYPSAVYVLPNRPSFAHGKTDSSAYGWFHWGMGATTGGTWKILDCGTREWRKLHS